jgi:hypothetical protein
MRNALLTAVMLTAVAVAFSAAELNAAEAATLVNASSRNVELSAKWSNLPYESPKIVLAPGERRHFSGPDGAALYVRFNSTPGILPARERSYRVITAGGVAPYHPGFHSYFRHIAPHVVDLFDR